MTGTSRDYCFGSLLEKPSLRDGLASWFHSKWGIPVDAYLQSMDSCLSGGSAVPQWYYVLDGQRIVAGAGVIGNDFHNRPDLSPNVCAVYVEEDCRNEGLAKALLDFICSDMEKKGVATLYLLTDHDGFYEKCGWSFLCPVQGDGEERMSRMYVHKN